MIPTPSNGAKAGQGADILAVPVPFEWHHLSLTLTLLWNPLAPSILAREEEGEGKKKSWL